MTLEEAKVIAEAAHQEAVKNDWTMCVAIVDEGGNLVYFETVDDTRPSRTAWSPQRARRC